MGELAGGGGAAPSGRSLPSFLLMVDLIAFSPGERQLRRHQRLGKKGHATPKARRPPDLAGKEPLGDDPDRVRGASRMLPPDENATAFEAWRSSREGRVQPMIGQATHELARARGEGARPGPRQRIDDLEEPRDRRAWGRAFAGHRPLSDRLYASSNTSGLRSRGTRSPTSDDPDPSDAGLAAIIVQHARPAEPRLVNAASRDVAFREGTSNKQWPLRAHRN